MNMDVMKEAFALLWEQFHRPTWGIKSPGLFSDIGKPARDVLYSDYDRQLFSFTALPILSFFGNTAITNSITDGIFGFNARHSLSGRLQASVALMDDKTPGKLEVICVHEDGVVCISTELTTKPTVTYSQTLGVRDFFFGINLSFDKRAQAFTQRDLGVSFTRSDVTVALTLREMGDALSASYHREILSPRFREFVWSAGTTRVAADLTHRFSSARTSLTFGVRHQLDDSTSVGVRVRSSGKVMASLQHSFGYWPPRALVSISGEVDLRCIDSGAKIGLGIAMQ